MEIKIEKAKIKDGKEIAFLQRDVWFQTYPNKKAGITKSDIKNRFIDMDKKVERWKQNIKNQKENELILVAKAENKIVGFCVATKRFKENNITAIYIDPAFQRQGIGSMFMKKIFSWFGDKKVYVLVAEYNKKAVNFYKKFGFVDTGKRIKEEFLKMKSGNYIIEVEFVWRNKKSPKHECFRGYLKNTRHQSIYYSFCGLGNPKFQHPSIGPV